MDTSTVVDLGRQALWMTVLISAPLLGVALAVGVGGGIGALARYYIASWIQAAGSSFPWGIFVVNITGGLLMGMIVEASALKLNLSPELRSFLTVGILGGYTTFSTFSLDSVLLLQKGGYMVYFGPLGYGGQTLIQFIEGMDGVKPCPAGFNPASWMLDVLAGHDPNDQASARAPKVDYGASAHRPVKGMRIALARNWYESEIASVTPEMKKGIDEAVEVLRDQGAIVEDVVLPDIRDYHICGRVIITVEAHAIHRRDVIETPEKFGYTTRRRFQLGAFLSAEQYLSALRFRRKLQQDTRAAMRGYDLVMAANQWGGPEIFEEPQQIFHFLGKPSLSMPFNVTGQPAMTVCCGFGSDGFPLAFQLAGRPFDEASVFAAGGAYERATPWRQRRPTL